MNKTRNWRLQENQKEMICISGCTFIYYVMNKGYDGRWHLGNSGTKNNTRSSTYLRHVIPDPREHIGPNIFLKHHATQYYIVFGPISQRWRITLRIKLFSYPDQDSDLHQNRNNLSLRHTQPVHQLFWDIVLCIVFGPISQWWRIT